MTRPAGPLVPYRRRSAPYRILTAYRIRTAYRVFTAYRRFKPYRFQPRRKGLHGSA